MAWLVVEIIIIFFIFPESLGYALEEVSTFSDNKPVLSFRTPVYIILKK